MIIDAIPALPPVSLNFLPKAMKHAGLYLQLTEKNGYTIGHSSSDGFWKAVNNKGVFTVLLLYLNSWILLLGSLYKTLLAHQPQLHADRMVEDKKELNAVIIDNLYKDTTVVSNDFVEGKSKSSKNKN